MKINEIIREKRKALSLTQEQIAEYLGVSTPAVNKWEKGSHISRYNASSRIGAITKDRPQYTYVFSRRFE